MGKRFPQITDLGVSVVWLPLHLCSTLPISAKSSRTQPDCSHHQSPLSWVSCKGRKINQTYIQQGTGHLYDPVMAELQCKQEIPRSKESKARWDCISPVFGKQTSKQKTHVIPRAGSCWVSEWMWSHCFSYYGTLVIPRSVSSARTFIKQP